MRIILVVASLSILPLSGYAFNEGAGRYARTDVANHGAMSGNSAGPSGYGIQPHRAVQPRVQPNYDERLVVFIVLASLAFAYEHFIGQTRGVRVGVQMGWIAAIGTFCFLLPYIFPARFGDADGAADPRLMGRRPIRHYPGPGNFERPYRPQYNGMGQPMYPRLRSTQGGRERSFGGAMQYRNGYM
ncbi:hypothetical protein SeLEV6574_g00072 [Synchytrium endobioticum]|nr:hypothetical protein SeLEV6574_g00072 [Synchytrium endobioticum]